MSHPGWFLVIAGVMIAVVGLIWALGPAIPWPAHLPGDIAVERKSFRFYFPLATCLLLSLALTAVLWLVRHFGK